MAEGEMAAHGEPNVPPFKSGEQGELTWRFTNPGSILYGCHVPGHYEAGMVGDPHNRRFERRDHRRRFPAGSPLKPGG